MPLYELGRFGPGVGLGVALVLGLAFGWFLERAGLGNARKLAGQFYLTDLTVFKVMFTAIITALLGLFWLSRLGWLDLAAVYLPATHLLPQAAGGAIFGAGFVMGGLCPGTSCVAASSGRKDGLAVMVGMSLGILLFGELFPLLRGFYDATPLGAVTLPQILQLSYDRTVFLLVMGALAALAAADRVERSTREKERSG